LVFQVNVFKFLQDMTKTFGLLGKNDPFLAGFNLTLVGLCSFKSEKKKTLFCVFPTAHCVIFTNFFGKNLDLRKYKMQLRFYWRHN